jgi:hypothetical protein
MYVAYNGWSGAVSFSLPWPGTGKTWYRVTDTCTWAEGANQKSARSFFVECACHWCEFRTMPDTLSVTDNRNGKTYELKIENGCVRALDLRTIKSGPDDFGLMTYDPAFLNTASCKSAITFIDGDKGILEYRGYPIEVLAEKSNFLEVAYLAAARRAAQQGAAG